MKSRKFNEDFQYLLAKLKDGENFAFTRFSDGELDILQNLRLILETNHVQVGDWHAKKNYRPVDHKDFNPEVPEHQVFRESLFSAFKFRKHNYFKGLSCRCCVKPEDADWMIEQHGPGDDEHLTWANLLVNGNYTAFVEQMIPVFSDKKNIMICHESADLKKLPFPLVKEFRVGYNAFINDLGIIDDMVDWIQENDITEHVFLFSASSFSALAIHKLFDIAPENTYINIGTTLNPYMEMPIDRGYLSGYWHKDPAALTIEKTCIW